MRSEMARIASFRDSLSRAVQNLRQRTPFENAKVIGQRRYFVPSMRMSQEELKRFMEANFLSFGFPGLPGTVGIHPEVFMTIPEARPCIKVSRADCALLAFPELREASTSARRLANSGVAAIPFICVEMVMSMVSTILLRDPIAAFADSMFPALSALERLNISRPSVLIPAILSVRGAGKREPGDIAPSIVARAIRIAARSSPVSKGVLVGCEGSGGKFCKGGICIDLAPFGSASRLVL